MPDLPQSPSSSAETLPQYSAKEDRRRSAENATRPLPTGWFRHFDSYSGHHYYVDMTVDPPRSIWLHPLDEAQVRTNSPENENKIAPSKDNAKRGFVTKLKAKVISTWKEEREAERRANEAKQQELLRRYSKRREEVVQELQKNGGRTQFGGSEYVGPPESPYGGQYRGLTVRASSNLAGWLA